MVRDELKAEIHAEFSAELMARALSRLTDHKRRSRSRLSSAFVAAAKKVGFLRSAPDLGKLVEAP